MFEQAFKNIDDVLRKQAACTTELDYTEQTSWLTRGRVAFETVPQLSGAADFEPEHCIMPAYGESCAAWSEAIQARD